MRLSEICHVLALPVLKGEDPSIHAFQADSRLIQQGDIFFALPGERQHGLAFLHEAASKGALAAVVPELANGPNSLDLPLLHVPDPLDALQRIAHHKFLDYNIPTIAITGSVGKTTTKMFLKTLLEKRFSLAVSPKNYNSQIGLPLTLLNHVRGDEEWIILEMGMTEKGHIRRLVEIAPPDIALLLTVDLVHAQNFRFKEEIALAKAEIFSHPYTRLGIHDYAIPAYDAVHNTGSCRKKTYADNSRYADVTYFWDGTRLLIRDEEAAVTIEEFPLSGRAARHNFVAAALAARETGLSWSEIQERVPALRPVESRGEFVEIGGILFFNDAYNASESSMKAALEVVAEQKVRGRKIAVLGSMLELGSFADECHRRVGEFAMECVDRIYCFGEECLPIHRVWEEKKRFSAMYQDKKTLVDDLRKIASPGDLILLKGSNSKALWEVLELW